jgi:hypothetical protein
MVVRVVAVLLASVEADPARLRASLENIAEGAFAEMLELAVAELQVADGHLLTDVGFLKSILERGW